MQGPNNNGKVSCNSKSSRCGSQPKPEPRHSDKTKVNEAAIRDEVVGEVRLLPENIGAIDSRHSISQPPSSTPRLSRNCSLAQLPFLLSYELLRESQDFIRIRNEKMGNKGWYTAFSNWDMPLVKSPLCFCELFDYIPIPWLDIPEAKRKRFGNVGSRVVPAYPIRGEDLLDVILKTCFDLDCRGEYHFPPRRSGLDKGCADEDMFRRVPELRYGVEYILMELDPLKSKNDLMLEFKRGLKRYYTEKKVTRASSIRDMLVKLVSSRLHKMFGGFRSTQEYLRSNKFKPFNIVERTFKKNAEAGEKLITEYNEAVKRSLATLPI